MNNPRAKRSFTSPEDGGVNIGYFKCSCGKEHEVYRSPGPPGETSYRLTPTSEVSRPSLMFHCKCGRDFELFARHFAKGKAPPSPTESVMASHGIGTKTPTHGLDINQSNHTIDIHLKYDENMIVKKMSLVQDSGKVISILSNEELGRVNPEEPLIIENGGNVGIGT